jgi:hypothetical protein
MKLNFYFVDTIKGYKKYGADIIRDVENTPFSHFAVGLDNGEKETIYEAVFPRVHKISKEKWSDEYSIIYSFSYDIPENKFLTLMMFLERMVGKFYGFDQCVWIALLAWFKIKKAFSNKVILNGTGRLICSEVGYLICKEFFVGQWDDNIDRVDLNDMYYISNKLSQEVVWK